MNIKPLEIVSFAKEAGERIMEIYDDPKYKNGAEFKADGSPLTVADKASHQFLFNTLTALTPNIPVLSEEGEDIPYSERKDWERFWCVDPLDGTKEFIKRNGEFTVNIALIENRKPTLGVIYLPARGICYFGSPIGAFSVEGHESPKKIACRVPVKGKLVAARSRSHSSSDEEEVFKAQGVSETVGMGSAIKFCLLAEGKVDLYYRNGPTMEWDTAAGQAIVEAAGGRVFYKKTESFLYNKEVLKNEDFICYGW